MFLNLLINATTGDINSAGWVDYKPKENESVVSLPIGLEKAFQLRDGQGRTRMKWDLIRQEVIEIPEGERIKRISEETKKIREDWKKLSQPEKIEFLARHLGLIE